MNIFHILHKIYQGVLIYAINLFREKSEHIPYRAIVWLVKIIFTLTLPLTITRFVVKVLGRFITDKDKEDSLREASEILLILQNTSEFEYRYPFDVFSRIHAAKDGRNVAERALIPVYDITAVFIAFSGKLFKTRIENKDEFVSRHLTNQKSDVDQSSKLKDFYEQRYEITMKNCQGDLFKAYYMGIEILAIKKLVGNKKEPPRQQHLKPQPLTN